MAKHSKSSGREAARKSDAGFIFRRDSLVGALDADDDPLLADSFVDTGIIETLSSPSSQFNFIVGRTGVGKTALLRELERRNDNVVLLNPRELSINHVSDSTVLALLNELQIPLDNFFELLWKHIFCVELLKKRYKISDPAKQSRFWEEVQRALGRNTKKLNALAYLREWGDKFWEETEERVRDFIEIAERKLQGELGTDLHSLGAPLSGKLLGELSIREEERQEIKKRSKKVVDLVQMRALSEVLNSLDDIFDDSQCPYFVLVDFLDTNWADDQIKYDLLLSLMDTIKKFRKVSNIKIIATLREDLLESVYELGAEKPGFQREKYNSLKLEVKWNERELEQLIDSRLEAISKKSNTNNKPSPEKILPRGGKKKGDGLDYIIARTLFRPREIIDFVNRAIQGSEGKEKITSQAIHSAEPGYSRDRLSSLIDEWKNQYPLLRTYVKLVENRQNPFRPASVTTSEIDQIVSEFFAGYSGSLPELEASVFQKWNSGEITPNTFVTHLVKALYRVGIIGIKRGPTTDIEWSHTHQPVLPVSVLKNETRLYVHPMVHQAVGTVHLGSGQ